ncbi:dipeptidase [Chloroflexi bacterium TSY]|nr:dipeptidase [Chloroflexi bacterium TSY]
MTAQAWDKYLQEHQESHLAELLDFLRIPSISSLPDHAADVRSAGGWVANRLRSIGIENVQIMETGGHPVVYGDWLQADDKPTIMIYGHFDTQPVDPLDLWTDPPFEPVIKDERIYAREASDDKGNMFVPILAVEALLKTDGALPVNLKFFFEGQEEIGSPQLPGFIETHRDQFACDMVVSADGGQFSEEQPELMIGLRGLAAMQIDVKGASTDLHSGLYGGAVANPLHALAEILATMRTADGKIQVEGFFDDVLDLSDDDRSRIAKVPSDDEALMEELGITGLFGEPGYNTLEQRWARPTLEINGMWGGFQGAGVKTVLPNEAHAKITCRLVANQNPAKIVEAITAHVKKHTPSGVVATVKPEPSGANPYLMPADHPGNQAAATVHQELYGKEPFYVRSGGSIPFCSLFKDLLGVYTVNFAFGLNDEGAHAPDEFWRISSFERGKRAYCMLLHELGSNGNS